MTVRTFTIENNIKNKEFPLIGNRFSEKILKINKVKKIIKPAKRENSMNMRIPLEVSANGMNNIRGSKVLIGRFRNFRNSLIFMMNIMKLIFEDTINSGSKFRKKSFVIEKEFSALLENSKKGMSVMTFYDIIGNFLSPCSGIFETA